jgi:Cytochrome C'
MDRLAHMRVIGTGVALAFVSAAFAAHAQPPSAKPPSKVPSTPTGTLAQVMRGIYFPNANLIFDVQKIDPGAPKKKSAEGGGSATDTYGNAYTGWEVVENAAVALTDGVDLILAPGRSCQNGKPVPYRQADFQKFAGDMRKAGLAVLQAAHTRNQEKVSDATNDLADACSNCHEVYRDKGPADSPARCSPAVKK